MLRKGSSTLRLSQAIGLAMLATSAGIYAVILGTLDNRKLALVLLVLPAILGLATLRHATRAMFLLLVISLCFSARFRPLGQDFHPGGAELAIAPLDFPLLVLVLLRAPRFLKSPRVTLFPDQVLRWGLGLFLISHIVSSVAAPDRGLALLELLRLFKMALLVFVIFHYLNSRRNLVFIVEVLLLIVVLQGFLAVAQSVFHLSFGLGFLGEHELKVASRGGLTIGRAGGTLGHPNVLANFFEVLTPIGFALILSGVEGRLRLLTYGSLLFGIVGTFLTFSRAGWLSLAVGLLLVGFRFRKQLPKIRVVSAILLVSLVVGTIGVVFQDTIMTRLTAYWETSILIRTVTAQTALNMLRSRPLFGIGINNYLEVSKSFANTEYASDSRLSRVATAVVHNIVLLYGAELGLFGLFAFALLLLSLVRIARQISRQGDPFLASLSAGALAGMIALIAHGMGDWLFRYDPVYTLFWFNVGLLAAAGNILFREQRTKNVETPPTKTQDSGSRS